MKKMIVILVLLATLVLAGCQTAQEQKALRAVVRTAIDYGQLKQQAELIKCGEAPDCPKAEQIQIWLDTGNRFLTYLEQPVPPTDYEKILMGIDIVIAEMKNAGADPMDIFYVQVIKNIAGEMFSG